MEFQKVVEVVNTSIIEFESWVQNNSSRILSEADFERHLSNVISNNLPSFNNDEGEYVVHNQISHYPGDNTQYFCKRDAQVDVLIMKDGDIKKDSTLSKGFVYLGDAIPIELKYYRKDQSISSIIHDLEKSETLLSGNKFECYFFVIALLEEDDKIQKSRLMDCFDKYKDRNNMKTYIISKTKTNK